MRAVWAVWAVRAVRAGVGHGLEPVKHCFSWQRRWRPVQAVWALRAAGVGHGLEPVKHCSWQGRCGGGGEGGVGSVGGESGEGGGGWAWTGACKTLLFMAEAVHGGGEGSAGGVGGEGGGGWAWTGTRKTLLFMAGARAVRAAGVGHGLKPVKHCFSWQRRWGR